MGRRALACGDVVVGVDTHKDKHVAVALDGVGRRLGELEVPATKDGYAKLLQWGLDLGAGAVVGVEGTGDTGLGWRASCDGTGTGSSRCAGRRDVASAASAARAIPLTSSTLHGRPSPAARWLSQAG